MNNLANSIPAAVDEQFEVFAKTVQLLHAHPGLEHCPATQIIVDSDAIQTYFDKQPNKMLVRNASLSDELLGMVIVRDTDIEGVKVNLFLVLIAPMHDKLREQFTIVHELGHVLLHGGLMYAGTVLAEKRWNRSAEHDQRRRLMELEANIYALFAIIPSNAITSLQSVTGRPVTAEMLQVAMSFMKSCTFPHALAMERMIMHGVLQGDSTAEASFHEHVASRPREASWILGGAGGKDRRNVQSPKKGIVSSEELQAWKARMDEAAQRTRQEDSPLRWDAKLRKYSCLASAS